MANGGGTVDRREKHLEMIQAVISRLAGNSFTAKGWSVSAAAALAAFAAQVRNPLVVLAALLPTLVFWGLDAYYLLLERRFRALYDAVRNEAGPTVPAYLLDPYWLDKHPNAGAARSSWGAALLAGPVAIVHGSVSAAVIAVTLLLAAGANDQKEPTSVRVLEPVPVRVIAPPDSSPAPTSDDRTLRDSTPVPRAVTPRE